MLDLKLWIGLGLTAIIIFSTTAYVSIRHFSRVRLSERLERRGRQEEVNRLVACCDELLFGMSLVRMSATLALVLLITHGILGEQGTSVLLPYGLIFIVSLAVVILVGVAIPNAWARYGGDAFLAAVLPVLLLFRRLFYPILAMEHFFDALARRLAGIPRTAEPQAEADQIGKEILNVVSEGELAGAVRQEDAEMIESVMKFRHTDVGAIMTPRIEMVALPATATLIEAKELSGRSGHSRIPVYQESLDDIKGVLYAKDLLNIDENEPFDPLEIMRKVPFVPETKSVPDLLQEFRAQKVHLAIVLDEYGGTAGLVTIEDILEEIVGEIADEHEIPEPAPLRRVDPHTLEVDARVHIDELNEALQVQLPEDGDYDTVGGFLSTEMGKIPATGEVFCYRNIRFQVLAADERRINRLRVQVIPDKAPA